MSTFVTVNTSATSSVLVPFTSAANAAIAQAALDATDNKFIALAPELVSYFHPADSITGSGSVPASVTVPATTFFGAVANTNSNTLDFGAFDSLYNTMVTGAVTSAGATTEGGGKTILVGSASTSVWSGANASLVYLNTNAAGAVFLGGNSTSGDAVTNNTSADRVNIWTGNDTGRSLTTVVDTIGGGATVHTSGNALMRFYEGGSDSVIANGGTTVVEAVKLNGAASGTLTISAASAGTQLTVLLGGAVNVTGQTGFGGSGPVFITPGAGNILMSSGFVSNGVGGAEQSATLFGGTRVLGGQTVTAAAFTGTAHVLRTNGYLEGGTAGGNELQTGTTSGAATLVAGGTGDKLWVQGQGDTAVLGNSSGVMASANFSGAFSTLTGGGHFVMGSGSGSAFGGASGYNDFVFTGAGTYTVIGGHDTAPATSNPGFLHGSVYHEASTAGGGNITILDFSPTLGLPSTATGARDVFDLGNASVSSLNSVQISVSGANTFYDNTAILSDGTTIVFKNTLGTVHQVGTSIV